MSSPSDNTPHEASFITVDVDSSERIAWVTFNRPEVRNAMHLPMNHEIREALDRLSKRDDVGALIFRGAGGKAFISGADIAELKERSGVVALERHNAQLCDAIDAFPFPTVALIEGYALGGGCEVALACDIRIAGPAAKMGQPEVGLGILPAAGGTWRLQRIVGVAKAKELIFTGDILDAKTCHEIGLVNHVVDAPDLVAFTRNMAAKMAAQSAMAIRLAKLAINTGRDTSAAAASVVEALGQSVLYDDAEKHRRMAAFLERKRGSRAPSDSDSEEP